MQYFYAFLWFAVGLILLFSMTKESKIFYFAGGFFLFLGAWWLADALMPEMKLFEGGWGLPCGVSQEARCWFWRLPLCGNTGRKSGMLQPGRKKSRISRESIAWRIKSGS